MMSSFLTLTPDFSNKLDPYGTFPVITAIPVEESTIRISPVRPITIFDFSPSEFSEITVRTSSNSKTPSNLAFKLLISETLPAVPPTWKVLRVNWVPGSPMDWAANTPTASPV